MSDLLFDTKLKKYFYCGASFCGCCDVAVRSAFLVSFHAIARGPFWVLSCHKCLPALRDGVRDRILYAAEVRPVMCVSREDLPGTAYPVLLRPLDLGPRRDLEGSTVWWAATSDKEIKSDADSSTQTINRCRLAYSETFEGCQVGMDPDRIPDKTKQLDHTEITLQLLEFKKAEPVVSGLTRLEGMEEPPKQIIYK